jgi:DNA-binding NtrC family response regulator
MRLSNGPGSGPDETLTDLDTQDARPRPAIVSPHLFVALDCEHPASGAARHSLANIDRVVIGRGRTRGAQRLVEEGARTLVLSLPDRKVSKQHASISRRGASFVVKDLGSRNGTRMYGATVDAPSVLAEGDLIEIGRTILRYRAAASTQLGEPADLDLAVDPGQAVMTTVHPPLARQVAALGRLAGSSARILLLGETGTGKEVVARALHRLSGRSGPFVAVNCAALPAALLESQLFGHVRGAFSGAVGDAPGLIRSAADGTLFLDEVGDLPGPSQAALLRVLQEDEVLPVGAVRPIKLDLRVVAATNRPLEDLVRRGEFRSDLFARLAAFVFRLPPLRDRIEDLGIVLARVPDLGPLRFTPSAGRALLQYDWPLNVRELHQSVRVAAALAGEAPIDLEHLPAAVASCANRTERPMAPALQADATLDALRASLSRHQGNLSAVARDLGKARMQIQRWVKRYRLEPSSFRHRP